jgi:hypothetical protein
MSEAKEPYWVFLYDVGKHAQFVEKIAEKLLFRMDARGSNYNSSVKVLTYCKGVLEMQLKVEQKMVIKGSVWVGTNRLTTCIRKHPVHGTDWYLEVFEGSLAFEGTMSTENLDFRWQQGASYPITAKTYLSRLLGRMIENSKSQNERNLRRLNTFLGY